VGISFAITGERVNANHCFSRVQKAAPGKSTSAVLLATELALKGAGVTILDADPNKPVSLWAKRAEVPPKTS